MATNVIRNPIFAIACDAQGCTEQVTAEGFTDWFVRTEAHNAGWQLRPRYGKGSRSAPDLCPEHRADAAEASQVPA